jgi:hypothetical protein
VQKGTRTAVDGLTWKASFGSQPMRSDVALVTADRHIIECRYRVAHQIKRIRAMERQGADTRLQCIKKA